MNQAQALFLVQSEGSPLFVSPSIHARHYIEGAIEDYFDPDQEPGDRAPDMSLRFLEQMVKDYEKEHWRNIDDGPNC